MKSSERKVLDAIENPGFLLAQAAVKSDETGMVLGQALLAVIVELLHLLEAMIIDCRARHDRARSLSARARIFKESNRKALTHVRLRKMLKFVQGELAQDVPHES